MSVATASASSERTDTQIPEDQIIVLFGATGDLARRKLLPGMFHLARVGLMPRRFRIIGAARHEIDVDEFRELARESVEGSGRELARRRGLGAVRRVAALRRRRRRATRSSPRRSPTPARSWGRTPASCSTSRCRRGRRGRRSTARGVGLGEGARVITEKPFGTDLESARELNAKLHSVFEERCIYRIDHYLGREAVQNLLAVRFANGMFEPVWNRNHIDHVQIDVPETLSIEMRGSFYEETGAFRDMIVTHLFQVLGFVAMEPPTSLEPKALGLEREKVFESMPPLRPENVVRGQYEGYRDEDGVDPDSDTETFVAIKAFVDNWRWEGVPFYLRSGKRLEENRHLLTVAFTEPPRRMFPLDCEQIEKSFGRDHLTFELGDPASISASFLAKIPGPTMQLGEAHMRFSYADSFGGAEQALDAYERLIHDVMVGDRTLFTSSDAIERLWEISEPVLARPAPVDPLRAGLLGPGGDRRADRAAPLAPAQRPRLILNPFLKIGSVG